MGSGNVIWCLCVCQFLWRVSGSDICPYQGCRCKWNSIICEGKQLNAIPQLIYKNTTQFTKLQFYGNQITTIPSGSLPPNLTQLSVQNNPLTSIDEDAFITSATTLKALTFFKPLFTRIPNALLYLQNLLELQVQRASILDWNVNVMKQIGPTLKILNVESVNFTSPPAWLQYLSNLTYLNIARSNLTSLPDNALDKMADTLITVYFAYNSLTEVPKALSNLTSLESLDLSNNNIVSTKWLPISAHLTSVYLSGNHLYNSSELSNALGNYAQSLVNLHIENNQLVSIPDLSFLDDVTTLSFRDNLISNYTSGALPSNLLTINLNNNLLNSIPVGIPGIEHITTIFLDSNNISHIQGTDFPPTASTIVLSNNIITALNDNSFPENSVINFLNLTYNPISQISPAAFKNLSLLRVLNLQGTKLPRMPLALASLVKLSLLDVRDIPGLVCTCDEKALEAWILSLKKTKVQGNCGDIGIYDFFSTLSPGCPTK